MRPEPRALRNFRGNFKHKKRVGVSSLTEVLEGLLYLFGREREGRVGGGERRVQPIILLVAEDGVRPQPVDWQLLLQYADDLELGQVSIVTHIWKKNQ